MSKDVFFLGAGFSIALANSCVTNGFRYPSLTELTELVKDRFTKASLATHLNEISSKYTENIESLLTYLSTDFPWQNQQMIHLDKALYFELVKNIRKTFVQLDRNCEYNFEPFNGFSKYIIENKIPLIEFNFSFSEDFFKTKTLTIFSIFFQLFKNIPNPNRQSLSNRYF